MKLNEDRWPCLAQIVRKVLSVPATSAQVEKMFSVSGHIFNAIFETLVVNKLDENLL